MQRYFVSKIDKDIFTLSESDSYHITTVMRMSLKDKIEIVYDSNEYLCEIISLDGNVKCRILEKFEKKSNICLV